LSNDLSVKVLLATPKIKDLYFRKTIILITGETTNSYLGLILNKTMQEKVSDIWDEIWIKKGKIHKNNNLRNGGPIYGPIAVLHKIKKYSEYDIFPKTFLSFKPSNIEKIIQNKTKPYEMYVGHCEWTRSQLAMEITKGNWWQIEPDDHMIFGDNLDHWNLKKEEQNKKILDRLKIKIQNHFLN